MPLIAALFKVFQNGTANLVIEPFKELMEVIQSGSPMSFLQQCMGCHLLVEIVRKPSS